MRRMHVKLELTAAQAAWLRGAVRNNLESDVSGGWARPEHHDWVERWLDQLSQPMKECRPTAADAAAAEIEAAYHVPAPLDDESGLAYFDRYIAGDR